MAENEQKEAKPEKGPVAGKRMVLLEFHGREVASNRIFDTTSEQEAREFGLYNPTAMFGAVPIVVGHGDVLPALDEAIAQMKEGESRTLRLSPEKAFGERRKELVVIAPLRAFIERKINPVPGLVVDINGAPGKVQTVSGGRVRVDLNNDLAGKEVEYELKIAKEMEGNEEKAMALVQKFFPLREKAEARLEKGTLRVKLPKELAQQIAGLAPVFTKTVKEVVPEIKAVEIVESFDAAKKEEAKATEHQHETKGGPTTAETEAGRKPEKKAEQEKSAAPEKKELEVKKTDSTMIVRPKAKEKPKGAAPSKSTDSTAVWHAKRKTKPS